MADKEQVTPPNVSRQISSAKQFAVTDFCVSVRSTGFTHLYINFWKHSTSFHRLVCQMIWHHYKLLTFVSSFWLRKLHVQPVEIVVLPPVLLHPHKVRTSVPLLHILLKYFFVLSQFVTCKIECILFTLCFAKEKFCSAVLVCPHFPCTPSKDSSVRTAVPATHAHPKTPVFLSWKTGQANATQALHLRTECSTYTHNQAMKSVVRIVQHVSTKQALKCQHVTECLSNSQQHISQPPEFLSECRTWNKVELWTGASQAQSPVAITPHHHCKNFHGGHQWSLTSNTEEF